MELLKNSSVLVVEDDSKTLFLLTELLKKEGYKVLGAESGEAALHILKTEDVSVILADHKLPDIEGIKLLQESQKIKPQTKRILITAYADKEVVMDAINLGQVCFFVPKPWDNQLLLEILRAAVEKSALEKEMLSMQDLVMENHKELAAAHKSLTMQLEIGAKIHKTLLLGKVPDDLPGLSVNCKSLSSKEIDGDFFEFYRPLPHVVDLVLGDVMGKGIPAALIATAVKTHLSRYASPKVHPFVFDRKTWWQEDLLSPQTILSNVYEGLNKELIELEIFVSLIFARLDLKKRVLQWIDLGFTKPIHWRSDIKKAFFLHGEGYPLGMVERGIFQTETIAFQENDLFIFYSDGVSEAKTPGNELFDSGRVLKIVEEYADKNPDLIAKKIEEEVIRFQGKDHFDDDFSLIVLKVDHYIEPVQSAKGRGQFRADMAQLKAVREFVERAAKDVPGNYNDIASDLKLAINEVFCNIVKHGYKKEAEKPIRIEISLDVQGVKVDVADKGDPFDPHRIEEPSLFGDRDDGYGWYLIRQLVDKVVYVPKSDREGWNHLSLYKKYCYEEERMEIIHTIDHDVLIITPMGDSLDAKETPEFKEAVLKLIDENKSKYVVFDLKELQFIDSSGLGSFLSILRRLHADEGDLKLCSMNKSVRSMFELVSMHKIFDILPTVDEAVKERA